MSQSKLQELQEQIRRDLEESAKTSQSSVIDRVRITSEGFAVPNHSPSATIEMVIVDFMSGNFHYPEVFDAKNPTPPNCFAIGRIPTDLAPDSSAPEPQNSTCNGCPKNEFESGVGRAKACKNTKLLALMSPSVSDEDAAISILTIPPSSIRFFDAYVATVLRARHELPPGAVVTEISLAKDVRYASPRFNFVRKLTDEELEYAYSRKAEAEKLLMQKPVMLNKQ